MAQSKLRIAFTGGGTGGHIYPLIAVAEALLALGKGEIAVHYFGPTSEWCKEFEARDIPVSHIAGAKLRRYASILNLFDVPKFFVGFVEALVKLYLWMPDVIFSKGGPGTLAVVFAAAWYRIPIVIHESDAAPGLTNRISAKLAKRIGISFANAASHFAEKKIFMAGNPIRSVIATTALPRRAAKSQLGGIDPDLALVLVLGGSQGAKVLNDFVESALPMLTAIAQVYHQTGSSGTLPAGRGSIPRYRTVPFMNEREMALALRAADVVLTRAGASAIYECAAAGAPAILVPLARGANDHQRLNAAEYAARGAALVLEENNLTPNLATGEIKKLLADSEKLKLMGERARGFFKPDAAETIAREVLGAAGAKVTQ